MSQGNFLSNRPLSSVLKDDKGNQKHDLGAVTKR